MEAHASDRVSTITGYEPKAGEMYFKFGIAAALTVGDEESTLNGQPTTLTGDSINDGDLYGVQGTFNYRISDHFSIDSGIGAYRSQAGIFTLTNTSTGDVFEDAGNVLMFPFSVALNYHFGQYGQLDPYVGAGLHYTFITNNYDAVSHGDGGGGALLKGGVNIKVNKLYSFFAEVEHKFLSSETDYFELTGLNLKQDVTIDPTTLTVGVGLRF